MTMRAVITLKPSSGLPRDEIVNRIHYNVVTTGALARAAVNTAIDTFFDTVDTYLSALILNGPHEVQHYDLDDVPPRIPVGAPFTFTFNTSPSTSRLPGEVAIVCSSKAAAESGIAPGSLRNRIYLGPIASTVVAVTGLIDGTALSSIANAFQSLYVNMQTSGDADGVVYSEKLNISRPVNNIWVNNEFDTQRRRGTRATVREERGV